LAILFLISFGLISRPRVPTTSVVLLGFLTAFLLVYLTGFFNLETAAALAQFAKGLVKFVIHFLFLAAAVAWLWRRGRAYYWRGGPPVLWGGVPHRPLRGGAAPPPPPRG